MIYLIIALTFFILSIISNKIIYNLDINIDKNLSNNILILLPNMIIPILIYSKYELSVETLSYIMLIPFLTLISIIDYRTTYVYDITIVSGIIMQCVIFLVTNHFNNNSMNHLKGLLVGVVISYIVMKITEALGEGDIGFYGLCCFVLGVQYSLYMMLLSSILASLYGIYLILTKTKSLKSSIPFTPFISLATILVMLTESDIINFYFDILMRNL
ncbi:MAG: prepilin peptidase [Terrisporobacter sp.]|uniref:prepilin peptidase n=1 Tax=Terrisporobacter sp. TaxID=1965305 RepID=UPI002FC5B446